MIHYEDPPPPGPVQLKGGQYLHDVRTGSCLRESESDKGEGVQRSPYAYFADVIEVWSLGLLQSVVPP